MSLRTVIKLGALLLGAVAISLAGWAAWKTFNVSQQLASSSAARWWRCQNVERPKLAASSPWTLTYSWSGVMGPGVVTFVLNSDGHATLTSRRHDQPDPSVLDYNVPNEEIVRIAHAVDQTGLLCQAAYPRVGYIVWDLGEFSVDISSGDYSRRVFVDECHTIPDPVALFEVRETLIALKPGLDDSIAWGPYGTATVPAQICADWNQSAK